MQQEEIRIQTETLDEPPPIASKLSAFFGVVAAVATILLIIAFALALFMSIHACFYGLFVDPGGDLTATWHSVIILWGIVGALILLSLALAATGIILLVRPQLTFSLGIFILVILACYGGAWFCARAVVGLLL